MTDITGTRYDPVAVTLHWVIALSVLLMIPLGLWMDELPISIKFVAYNFHKSLGITVLAFSIFRLIWRFLNPPPPLPASMKPIEKLMANAAHWMLYFLIIAMPLSGWLMVSASRKFPTVFFGLTEVPFVPMPSAMDPKVAGPLLNDVHYWLAYGALALIALHVGAALKHHFIAGDNVLTRMLPLWLTRKAPNA